MTTPDSQGSDNSDCSSDAGSDNISLTSTEVYSQEPFGTYSDRVRTLLSEIYGVEAATSADISRRQGGSFNRIIGIILQSADSTSEDLILRIPRFSEEVDAAGIIRQVGVLRCLRAFLPVPEVVLFDASSNNTLERAFMIMRRIPGESLFVVLHTLSVSDRCDLAVQLARLISTIHSMPVPQAVGPLSCGEDGQLCVARITKHDEGLGPDELSPRSAPLSLSDFISTRTNEIRDWSIRKWPTESFYGDLCDQMQEIWKNLLGDVAFSERQVLFHRDFAARNIIIHQDTADSRWSIKAVLDWDEADVAPLELASVWPDWLWSHADEPTSEISVAESDPDLPVYDEECGQIRAAFVSEIERLEPGYVDRVRLARDTKLNTLYNRARDGFNSNEQIGEISDLFLDLELDK
ncbi:hypothetical protein HGRIS_006584 [Hohenbuehelia grisea]|uniref:Aminoglycoside phosphotransferase domain-containing protein n=1 Tax=Hohenbuehelia grisea TaxID=104357 RepID=A0ABR3J9G6_9AGAR